MNDARVAAFRLSITRAALAVAVATALLVLPACRKYGGIVPEEPKEQPKAPAK